MRTIEEMYKRLDSKEKNNLKK